MAIQMRRGLYEDFDPTKMIAGEIAVVTGGDPASTTGRAIYVCFEAGVVKRIVDYDDIGDEIAQAAGIYIDDLRDVVADAESATTAAETATQNANTVAEEARQIVIGDISNKSVTFTEASAVSSLTSGETLATLFGKLQALISARSHVGMIIHSTTLDTQAKVKAQYGGTTWIRHNGYFLYGATSGVTSGHASADGGEATHTLTVEEMPSHTHKVRYTGNNANGNNGGMPGTSVDANPGYNDLIIANEGGGQSHNNMPPYKKVYIWERTA